MSAVLTKSQKQDLGSILKSAGYDPAAFVYTEIEEDKGQKSSATLTNRETSDKFVVMHSGSKYSIAESVPGTRRKAVYSNVAWDTLTSFLQDWAGRVKRESEAVDPWPQEAEDMADDDSYFGLEELPRVDRAIEESLNELKNQALEHGVSQDRVEAALEETEKILKKSARTSTKKEWLTLFKGVVIEKLIDWGMQTQTFQTVLHTLITSAHDIAQLAEHAARHMPT